MHTHITSDPSFTDPERLNEQFSDDREWDRFKEESTPEELAAYEKEMDAIFAKRDAILARVK